MMQKLIKGLLSLMIVLFLFISCQPPFVQTEKKSVAVRFKLGQQAKGLVTTRASGALDNVLLTIKDSGGCVIYNRTKVAVYAAGQDYLTESISLTPGDYSITEFLVTQDSAIAYVSPVEGSKKADLVHYPLPDYFRAASNVENQIPIEIIPVYSTDTLADFGYSGSIQVADQSVSKGLVAEYMYGGDTADTSGNNNNGTASSGLISTTDRFNNPGNAFRFGNTDYMTTAHPVAGSEISVSLWFTFEGTNNPCSVLIGTRDVDFHQLLVDYATSSVGINNNGTKILFPNSTLVVGSRYHLVLVKNGAVSNLYINGQLAGKLTTDFDNALHPVFIIGNSTTGSANGVVGVIDDIKIYNRTLSGAEISRLYTDKAPDVAITYPSSNAVVSGTINISAAITDDNNVASAAFYLNNTLIGSTSVSPYTWAVDTKTYTNGSYTITVKALDDIKNPKIASCNVTINNSINITRMPISAGYNFTMAIKPDNTLLSWGYNGHGELGIGSTTDQNVPFTVKNLSNVISTASGVCHSLALKNDGTIWAWGYNGYGQLGDESTINKTVPLQVKNIDNVVAIACGYSHSLALKSDKTVWTWGMNSYYELGHSGTTYQTLPKQVPGLTNVTAITAGNEFSVALKEDGTVWGWGYNGYGPLGTGAGSTSSIPVKVIGLDNIIAISACSASNHIIALKNDKTVWTIGCGTNGQLGNGNNVNSSTPVKVNGLKDMIAVAAGNYFNLAIRQDGTVWAWGYNGYGQLGDNSALNKYSPVQVSGLTNIAYIAAGDNHSVAVDKDGNIFTWGYNGYGQLGDASNATRYTPVSVNGFPVIWRPVVPSFISYPTQSNTMVYRTVAAGYWFSVALKDNGEVWGWGYSYNGEFGTGSAGGYLSPVRMNTTANIKSVAAGSSHTVLLDNTGNVWCSGYNYYGQIGNNSTSSAFTPVKISTISPASDIAAGYYHTIALSQDGTVWSWGYNGNGELGDGSGATKYLPVKVNGLSRIIKICAGDDHSLALKADGTVWAWGYNNYGQIGDGTTISKTAPIQIEALNNIIDISCGGVYSMALKADGTVWSWGYNSNGELGDGTTTSRYTPVRVNGLHNIAKIATSTNHAMAIDNSKHVWVWGYNGYGNLGDYTSIYKYTPVQLADFTNIVDIEGSSGFHHSIAKDINGDIYTWGYYQSGSTWVGAPGNGTNTNNDHPVKIGFNTKN